MRLVSHRHEDFLQEPLLHISKSRSAHQRFCSAAAKLLSDWRHSVRSWYALTTNPNVIHELLGRHFRPRSMLLLTLLMTLCAYSLCSAQSHTQQSQTAVVEVALLMALNVFVCILLQVFEDALWQDAFLVAVFLFQTKYVTEADERLDTVEDFAPIDKVLTFVGFLQILSAMGTHSLGVLAFIIFGLLTAKLPAASLWSFDLPLVCIFIFSMNCANEYKLACLWRDRLQANNKAEKAFKMVESAEASRSQATTRQRQLEDHQKHMEMAYSEALAHLKTPLLLARSDIQQAIQRECKLPRDALLAIERRIHDLWGILTQLADPSAHFGASDQVTLHAQLRPADGQNRRSLHGACGRRLNLVSHGCRAQSLDMILEVDELYVEDRSHCSAATWPFIGARAAGTSTAREGEWEALPQNSCSPGIGDNGVVEPAAFRVKLSAVSAHLRELSRHLHVESTPEAQGVLLAAIAKLGNSAPLNPCVDWVCALCCATNDSEDGECFCCLCERGMTQSEQ